MIIILKLRENDFQWFQMILIRNLSENDFQWFQMISNNIPLRKVS